MNTVLYQPQYLFYSQPCVEQAKQEIPLPMDHVISELSPQQRLAVYEHVIEVSEQTAYGLGLFLEPFLDECHRAVFI